MKTIMTLSFFLLLHSLSPSWAGEVRVDSTGGLDLVLSDETADINPYNFDNPAGLALLPAQSSFEISAPFYSVTSASGSTNVHFFGISPGIIQPLPNLESNTSLFSSNLGYQYQGLLYVPGNGWAFQATGGFNEGSEGGNITTLNSNDQGGKQLARVAYNFGLFTLGTELQYSEASTRFFNNSNEITGNESQSGDVLNSGFLANIPLDGGHQPSQLRFGCSFSVNVLPSQENFTYPTLPSVEAFGKISESSFEPSLYLDIPGAFQGGIILNFHNLSTVDGRNSSDPSIIPISPSKSESDSGLNGELLYKCKMAADPDDPHPLSFNHGLILGWISDQQSLYDMSGDAIDIISGSVYQVQFGFGLERERDFTLGLQADEVTGGSGQIFNYTFTSITLGLEKWVSSQWALRIGLTYIDDDAQSPMYGPGGGSAFYNSFFDVIAEQTITGVVTTAGAGYEDHGLKVDGMVWFEQPQSTGAGYNEPNYAYTVFGAQLGLALVL